MLIIGAILMGAAGLTFAGTSNFVLLIVAGAIGVISPSGNEVGPFLPIEQAALAEVVPSGARTTIFAWYALTGALAAAGGSLMAGLLAPRAAVLGYAAVGLALALIFAAVSPAIEG